ncbi:hypothetical protein C8A00DRAFT_42900 [Chaetomidium leptoderma]|uniref:ubiquitinyl hydrolase 1 n=1 Tax=Chaetomidium leptoderma TaxID=669021 RepID=A0AAN6ZW98_9PEZI|nr:hypothetical protein C8A00DRAFT_42900 [Chaetomidium leptoderma]
MSIDQVAARIAGLILDNLSTLTDSPSPVVQATETRAARRGENSVSPTISRHPETHRHLGGRLASRLVQDWFAGLPVHEKQDLPPSPLLQDGTSKPPAECPSLRVFPPRPNAGSDHDLMIIGSQSYDETHDPDGRRRSLLSCMCRYCRYHFVFHFYPPGHEETTAHLQHHFRVEEAEWHTASEPALSQPSKQNPVQGRFQYVCTLCGIAIQLEISSPRLDPAWIKMIMDENRIKENLRVAREQDSARYAEITPEKLAHLSTTAATTLNMYLKNILDDDGTGDRKRISTRNKTFLVQFGRDCDPIFRYLGFEEDHDQNTGESYWLPPRLPPQEGKTPVGSLRAFHEDVRSEVQNLLDDKPPVSGQPVVKPISARDQLEKALGCDKSHRCVSTLPILDNEARHFTTLGTPVDADDAMLKFAYNRQVEVDPEHTTTYLEALGTLSTRRSEELQMFVFTHQELLAKRQKETAAGAPVAGPIEKAYAHFGLTRACPEQPSYFTRVYRTYRDQSPAQKSDHRLALLEIGRDRNSEEIRNEVFGKPMELSEACNLLRVEPEWPMDSIAVTAQSVASELDLDHLDLLLLALDAISLHLPADDPNRPAFEGVLAEIRSSRQSQFISAGTGQAGAVTSVVNRSPEVADGDLPVGLANLRNTCYLNSILQYFYSVNAVRNLAVNSDLPALEPTEANLSNVLRTGSNSSNNPSQSQSDLETGRAFVGHEFTRELSTLFRALDATGDSSIPPRQRLANAALLRPEKLRPSDSDAPPLPPRAGESSVSKVPDAPMVEAEKCETASSGSSQTLINQPDGEDPPIATPESDQAAEKGDAMTVDGPAEQAPSDPTIGGPSEEEPEMSKLTIEELAAELDKPNVGSDQMDVDEVMGNAIDHLRAAFKVSSLGASDAAPDPIEQAFFSTFVDNRKKIGEPDWNRTSRSDRWVTAYPAQSGTRDLYDALSNSFDLEPLPGDLLSFTTIERPAPHFHICIQRSDGVRKNSNPITIPETLYLGRFMHTGATQSQLFRERKRRWDIKTRLNEIATTAVNKGPETAKAESQIPGRPSNPSSQYDDLTEEEVDGFLVIGGLDLQTQVSSSSVSNTADGQAISNGPALSADLKQLLSKHGVAEPEFPQMGAIEPPQKRNEGTALPPSNLYGFWEKFTFEENEERKRLIAERDQIFNGSHDVAYRLHAVVCHAGATASAGHYWVWIHDFERDVWRKYNDTTVSVHPAEFVFGELNTKGEPYYLAYVKTDEVQNLVSIPCRRPLTPPPVPPRPRSAQDTVMADADDAVVTSVEHLENAEMLPPAYASA